MGKKGNFLPFEEAREFVRSLGIKGETSWKKYYKSQNRNKGIPTHPSVFYKDKGWISWGDWFGTGYVANNKKSYLQFEDARKFVHSLGLKSQEDWKKFMKSINSPNNIPHTPFIAYKGKGWMGWNDWLGKKNQKHYANRKFRSFEDARDFVRSLKLKTMADWKKYSSSGMLPVDIPKSPEKAYGGNGWKNYADWLGNGKVKNIFLPYEEAEKFAHSLKISSVKEWKEYCRSGKKPDNIPSSPNVSYSRNGWKWWGKWLGISEKDERPGFVSFEDALEYVRSMGLNSIKGWEALKNSGDMLENLPRSPDLVYKEKGWIGWNHFLGTNHNDAEYKPFEEAREIAISLGFKTRSEWNSWAKTENRPKDIPRRPHETYKDKGWKNYSDWLGTEIIASYNREYLPFVEARDYVRSLKFGSCTEWIEFSKSEKRPHFIPTNPKKKYGDEWKDMNDWLGTELKGSIPFRTFQESRLFVHELNLSNVKEWNEYASSGKRPLDIPSAPNSTYKNDGWINWGDFLGTNRIGNTVRRFLSYEDAKKFVRKLKLRSQTEWYTYAKSEFRPKGEIPYFPNKKYKEQGWVSWNDFLGINTIREKGTEYLSFEEARKFVRSLGLSNITEYREYCKSGEKPFDIPSTPEIIYKESGWTYYGDFLGNGSFPRLKKYRSFEKAREFVNSLGLKNQKEWKEYVSSGKKPEDIPCNPGGVYRNDGWIGFGDWLGNGRIANHQRVYRSFVCAREFVHGLNLSTYREWQEYVESGKKPADIPATPYKSYKNKGWKGFGDWLGTFQRGETNRWNKSVTLQLLESLPLHSLTSAELLSIIRRSGALGRLNRSENFRRLLEGETANLKKSIAKRLLDEFSKMSDKEFDDSIDSEPSFTERTIEEGSVGPSENITTIDETNWFTDGKKGFREVLDEISELDNEGSVFIDDEVAQFLVNNRVQILWNCHMNGDDAVFGQYENSEGRFMRMVREEFEKQKRSVENQKRPKGYAFRINDRIAEPSLMQKLTAHLLSEKKGLINCSGVGAGKSLAAIYASRLLQCRNTLLIAFNSTVDEWKGKIIEYFPDTEVYVKGRYENIVLDRDKWNVVVLNYESFQQQDSSQRLQELVSNNIFDFVILDEVQFAKQSVEGGEEESGTSLRRRNIDGTLCTIRSYNPALYVLGMSATPVVTNLVEAKKLLEMVKGQEYVDLDTRASIENALAVHVQLVNNGIRYRPAYDITVRERHLDVDVRPLLGEIVSVGNGRVLSMENVLIDLKLNACRDFITKGTMIYSHYTDDGRLLDRIKSFVEGNGLSCGIYSGEDKSGKYDFISGRTDVLVGSSSVNTGLDGIQKVCNRIIILSLPWTHSQYEQLKGRIYRQGSSYSEIEVVIPFPEIKIGENRTWSWDRDRYNRVMERKTLADAALDGIIPDDRIRISESTLLSRCQKSLSEWIEEIKRGSYDEGFVRPSIMVRLSSEETERLRKRYNPGDFTKFHQNWALEKSSTTHEKFKKDPSLWRYYHDMMDEHSSKWSEQPYRVISSNIRRSEWLIADLGCGQNRLRLELPMNKIEAFDHVAIDDSVIECDISRLPVEDERYDAVVMSLSLMGRNQLDYLKEAHRVLKHKQWLYVAEPKGKWKGDGEELVRTLREAGFGCQGFRMTEDFIYVEGWKN